MRNYDDQDQFEQHVRGDYESKFMVTLKQVAEKFDKQFSELVENQTVEPNLLPIICELLYSASCSTVKIYKIKDFMVLKFGHIFTFFRGK